VISEVQVGESIAASTEAVAGALDLEP